ncbi:hypothetical protein DLAC_07779 [Tieghemostelium lacteum]|uniref:Carbohydrate binding domain-containing protein n=1 Tax=Tieghemostelium lacteum TaxID=361077 RepID=A0A151ZAD7_TIELA|nr:hypothetical protein DLAC_07779 [Tieghemostelium lacteum]|eukprot:KYQ90906.1 hypothetical protein DLAC_07779 [Tieghemostelium lacteum]
MKAFLTLTTLLLSIAVISASYPCGTGICGDGELCYTRDSICRCMRYYECHDVDLTVRQINSWTDAKDNCVYTQYDVDIRNHMNRNIKQIFIGTSNMQLKDNNSIWGARRLHNGDVTLLENQDVNANAVHTFGFIVRATKDNRPSLFIKAVVY